VGRLDGQVAVVTGASSGLGSPVALTLAREGAAVIAHAWPHAGPADQVVETIVSTGGRARAVAGDLAQPAEAAAVVAAAAETFGRIDILVNNAGITHDSPILRLKDEDWQAIINTTLTGTFYCIRAALREFVRQRRGRIINITSTVGQGSSTGRATHVAARAGVIGLTRAIAREVGSRGITVNAVAPGVIPATGTGEAAAEQTARLLAHVPLGRTGTAAEMAAAVVFLASEEAGYITGQVLNVDGGMVMH
jgi:3-oxoacyl-[acyl-carrier protein] reductase